MRTLIVEDSASMRRLLESLLRERGHDVVAVPNAETGWKEHVKAPFDLLIVDCVLPGRSGTDLTRLVRRAEGGDATTILMMTGRDGADDLEEILDSGADDFLAKPFDPDQLRTRLLIAERHVAETRRRRRAEEALKRSERTLRDLVDSAPDGIWVHAKGVVTYANPAALRTLGHAHMEDLLGQRVVDLIHPDDRARHDTRTPIDPNDLARDRETRVLKADGSYAITEFVEIPIVFGGEPSELLMMRDLTERRELQARMQQADRLASVGTLAAGVAHELNNPLAYVVSNIRLLSEEIARIESRIPPETMSVLRELVEESAEGTKRMGHIVRDLKTFSRADDETRGPVDLDRIIESSINMAWNQVRHRAKLVKEIGPTPRVEANESRLGQVVVNLLVNAAQALSESASQRNVVRVRTWTDTRGWAMLAVEDNGAGIPEEVMARIFDPFFTTKPAGEGTGLGLSIVRNIVRGAGGEIRVESEVGVGTSVVVELPPARRRTRKMSSGVRQPAHDPSIRMRVLVVDDEPLVGKSLRRALRDHEVVVVTDGEEAVRRLIGDDQSRFDVVLCDLMMPDVTGMDVYERVKRARPDLAETFVFMTGGAFTPRGREFLDSVVNEHVEKPFDVQIVRSIVRMRAPNAGPETNEADGSG